MIAFALRSFEALYLNPPKRRTIRDVIREFDFAGLFLVVAGIVLILVGFSNAGSTS
jgi:hypothetical protein